MKMAKVSSVLLVLLVLAQVFAPTVWAQEEGNAFDSAIESVNGLLLEHGGTPLTKKEEKLVELALIALIVVLLGAVIAIVFQILQNNKTRRA